MRSILCVALLAALSFATSSLARAQTQENTLTAAEAVREAIRANLDLQAARLSVDIALGNVLQAGRLDNPELGLNIADDFAFESEGERSWSVGFAQKFPVTARLAREKGVARKSVDIAQAEIRNFVRLLISDVQSAFYSVRSLDEQLAVNLELIESVRQVEKTTARRVEAAEASPAEVSILRIERLRLEQNGQRLTREREVAAAALTRLLGRDTSARLQPVGGLDPGEVLLGTSESNAQTHASSRTDFETASRALERADADRTLAQSEIWEDWTLSFGYEDTRDVFDEPAIGIQQDSFLTLGVTVPLPLWNRQQGRIASAEAEVRRSRRSRDALALRIGEEIRAAGARVRTLRSSVDAYAAEILPEAASAQKIFERGYRAGLLGIAELLQAQRQYNESRAVYFELLGELRQATIALEAARGTSPHLREFSSDGGNPL